LNATKESAIFEWIAVLEINKTTHIAMALVGES
jgi:hypothetical protein